MQCLAWIFFFFAASGGMLKYQHPTKGAFGHYFKYLKQSKKYVFLPVIPAIFIFFVVMAIVGSVDESAGTFVLIIGGIVVWLVVFSIREFMRFRTWKGSNHHIKITDNAFNQARKTFNADISAKAEIRKILNEAELLQYETDDFPVADIVGTLITAYRIEEKVDKIPEHLQLISITGKQQTEAALHRISAQEDQEMAFWTTYYPVTAVLDIPFDLVGGLIIQTITGVRNGDLRVEGEKMKNGKRLFYDFFMAYPCGNSKVALEYLYQYVEPLNYFDSGALKAVLGWLTIQYINAEVARKAAR